MSDAPITKAPPPPNWVDSFTSRAREALKGSITKAGQTGLGSYARGAGATFVEVGEGMAVGSLLGAAKVRFGIDASPGLMGAAALVSIVACDVAPTAAEHMRAIAGQSAAVMSDRATQRFLTGWPASPSPVSAMAGGGPAMKTVGAHGEGSIGGDRILQKAAEIARRANR